MVTLYHNPRCSKSRAALALLRERGIEPEVVLYLETPPDEETLTQLLAKLGMAPRELLRKGEPEYRELGLADPGLSDEEIVRCMVRHPRLIERPIAVAGDRAVVGRPPERVLEILDD
ncbi:MAG: arsenate reductase [Porticoccaceae bacterium]|nr:MAG: arsenate reductase [Porticoccaceae bacterium]